MKEVSARERRRIDWILARCRGRVLDLGCGGGAVLRLYGGPGVGIEIDSDLAQRARDAAPCAEIWTGDAETFSMCCDTLVMAEVLEHQARPIEWMMNAVRRHAPGRVIVTTPLGYYPHPDHRSIVWPMDLVRALPGATELDCEDGWIRFVWAPETDPAHDQALALSATQKGCEWSQRWWEGHCAAQVARARKEHAK